MCPFVCEFSRARVCVYVRAGARECLCKGGEGSAWMRRTNFVKGVLYACQCVCAE